MTDITALDIFLLVIFCIGFTITMMVVKYLFRRHYDKMWEDAK